MAFSTIVATNGFNASEQGARDDFMMTAFELFEAFEDVDYIVGDPRQSPGPAGRALEDGGRTLRVHARDRFYAKVDGRDATPDEWAESGHPEYPILTFLLPSDY